ncbi:MAG: two-component system sensor histidine kinase NtrB [Planctomycetaceae bacterium]
MSERDFDAQQLRGLLDALDVGVAVVDAGGRVLLANRRLGELFQGKGREFAGEALGTVLPGVGGEIDWARAAQHAVERERTTRLGRHPLPGGFQVDVALGPVRLVAGEGSLGLLTVVDVSEAVRLEERLLRQARTQAIANLGDSVAHEIRNPLNSIHMNVQLLREGLVSGRPPREELDRIASIVQREIKRLDRVVRDFVQYSRPPALHLAPGSVNRVVRAALDLLDAQIREKRLAVEIDLQSARPVRMDPDRLQRAIYNVLLNAVQVLAAGGSLVCRSRDEKDRCLLEFTDNGPGLDLVKTPHLFDLFYTTKPGGTGLGLPLANRIVEEHGGRMAVASRPGQGATFALFLPYDGPPPPREAGPTAVPVGLGEGE